MQKVLFFVLCACVMAASVSAQELQACDLLDGKDFKSLYQEADFVCLARITGVENGLNGSKYFHAKPTHSFKGIPFFLGFNQLANPQFFSFRKDSTYVFFVFKKHKDDVFMPCLFFGIPERMQAFLEWSATLCQIKERLDSTNSCLKSFDPKCGCDGITYENDCLARKAGIQHWVNGDCKKLQRK